MIVVRLEMAVVERLRVVRIRAGLEQQPRQRVAFRMRQLDSTSPRRGRTRRSAP